MFFYSRWEIVSYLSYLSYIQYIVSYPNYTYYRLCFNKNLRCHKCVIEGVIILNLNIRHRTSVLKRGKKNICSCHICHSLSWHHRSIFQCYVFKETSSRCPSVEIFQLLHFFFEPSAAEVFVTIIPTPVFVRRVDCR